MQIRFCSRRTRVNLITVIQNPNPPLLHLAQVQATALAAVLVVAWDPARAVVMARVKVAILAVVRVMKAAVDPAGAAAAPITTGFSEARKRSEERRVGKECR